MTWTARLGRALVAAGLACALSACSEGATGTDSNPAVGLPMTGQPMAGMNAPMLMPPVDNTPADTPVAMPPMDPPVLTPPMDDMMNPPMDDTMDDMMDDTMDDMMDDTMDDMMDDDVVIGDGMCCDDGNCLCHGPDPSGLTASEGPYNVETYTVSEGCIYYPTDAEPPFAAVTVSDGFIGTGGCGIAQTGRWGPLYASWGIVTMIINTGGGDQPPTRGSKLGGGIEAFKAENEDSGSPLYQKLSGRYGTSGFSMGGGGTTYASEDDPSLMTSVAIMPWGPTRGSVTVPTLVICGASDGIASCTSHGTPYYGRLDNSVPKMRVTVSGGHNGQPSAGGSESGEMGLAFQKVFLEGDERWRPFLAGADSNDTNIQ